MDNERRITNVAEYGGRLSQDNDRLKRDVQSMTTKVDILKIKAARRRMEDAQMFERLYIDRIHELERDNESLRQKAVAWDSIMAVMEKFVEDGDEPQPSVETLPPEDDGAKRCLDKVYEVALLKRDNEQLRQQVIHHVERIGAQSEIITKLTEGAKARNKMMERLAESVDSRNVLLMECLDCHRDEPECRLDHNDYCQAHDCDNPCLVWKTKQLLRE